MNTSNHASSHDLERLNAELEIIQQTSLRLTASLDLPDVLDYIAKSALFLVDAMDCHIYLYDKKTEQVTFGTAYWQAHRRIARN